jgi:hypothetical protein
VEGDDDYLGKSELIALQELFGRVGPKDRFRVSSAAVRRLSVNSIALAVGLAASMGTGPAFAQPAQPSGPPDKETCVASFDRGQRAQSDRALRRALGDLIVCAQESCPTVLRADCAGVLAEVRSALPSIVFAADDGNGHELTDVKVFAGAELIASKLDGRAIAVDPGAVELRFEVPGRPPLVTTRMIREGEKSRVIRVSLPGGAAATGAAPDAASDARGEGARDRGTAPAPRRSTLGWVLPTSLAGVGLAGLGVALVMRLRFDGRVDDLRGSCAPDCSPQQRSDLSGTLVVSNVALGAGIGALALGLATWFLTAPPSSSPGSSTRATSRAIVPGGFAW